jgi:thiol-disulfide isomerase/thioredoxin
MNRVGKAGIALALAALLALGAGALWRFMSPGEPATRDGSTLLALSLPDTAGRQESLAQWKGRVLIVNFWATWCEPCREEMPRFMQLQERDGPKGLQFVGIAIDQADKVAQFASDIKLNYPTLVGGYGAIELSKTLGNRLGALPFTVVLDRSGGIVHTQLGPLKDAQLRSMIAQLL